MCEGLERWESARGNCKVSIYGALVERFPFVHLNYLMEMEKKNPKTATEKLTPKCELETTSQTSFFTVADDSKCLKTPQSCKADSSLEPTAQLWNSGCKTYKADNNHWPFFSNCWYFQTNVPAAQISFFGHWDCKKLSQLH